MTKEELIDKTDKAITELVYPKYDLQKAYNYYNGVRDEEQFRYLEENFGIGNPTSLQFTPLIKKHVDALVGEYLGRIFNETKNRPLYFVDEYNGEKEQNL